MSRVMGLDKFAPSWRFLSDFSEFPKIKSSSKTGVSRITKYLNINSILSPNITKLYTENYSMHDMFLTISYLHKQESYDATKIYCASDDIARL